MGYLGNGLTITGTQNSKRIVVDATPNQTISTVTGGYLIGQLDVYRNGVKLVDTQDYTASDGVSVNFLSAASEGDELEFVVFENFDVANALSSSGGTVSGDLVVTGIATFNSDVSIGGTLTYEDVTNVDSVGLITARAGVEIGTPGIAATLTAAGGAVFTGVVTARSGVDVGIADSIFHIGDDNTSIRFPAADTFTVETGGSEALRVDSAGDVGIGTEDPTQKLHLFNRTASGALIHYDGASNNHFGLRIRSNSDGGNFESDFRNGTTAMLDLFADASTVSGGDFLVCRSQSNVPILLVKANGRIGIGTDNPQTELEIQSPTDPKIRLESQESGNKRLELYVDGGEGVGIIAADQSAQQLAFRTAGSERIRIDASGDVGIGTDNPSRRLELAQSNSTAYSATDFDKDYQVLKLRNYTNDKSVGMQFLIGGNGEAAITAHEEDGDGSTTLAFGVRNSGSRAERMRIDSSGRLLVGHSSDSMGCNVQSATTGGNNFAAGRFADNTGGPDIVLRKSRNATVGSHTIVNSGDDLGNIFWGGSNGSAFKNAARITAQVDGTPGTGDDMPGRIVFYTSADGSTTPTEHFRIDSTGQLLASNYKSNGVLTLGYDANGNNAANDYINFVLGASDEKMRLSGGGDLLLGGHDERTYDDTSDTNVILDIYGGATAGKRGILSLSGRTGDNGADIGTIWFNNDNNSGASPGSTMKLVSALQVTSVTSDGNAGSDAGSIMRFYTKPEADSLKEVVRFLNTGQAQFKGNASDFHGFSGHQFVADANDTMMVISNTNTTMNGARGGIHILYTGATPNGTTCNALQFDDASANRFALRSNGGIANYQSNDANLCDEREKKNIVSLDDKWDKVKSWELKKFHYNEDADTDDKRYGVIAQQVAEDCPELITDWITQQAADAVLDDDGNVVTPAKEEIVRMGVKEQQMMWMAIKALQEAQTRIETLETQNTDLLARVTALEG